MSETATFLKIAATSIVLRLLEESDISLDELTMDNPIRAIREISHDITCRRKVKMANGKEMNALEIQGAYLEKAQAFADSHGLDEQETRALALWEYMITTLTDDPMKLDRECDWVIKHKLIDAYRERHDVTLASPEVALVDLQYHDINRERGLFYRMQNKGMVERLCDDTIIQEAIDQPPQRTRAKLRGDFIKAAKEKRRDFTVDWVHLKVNDNAQRTVLCKDPFKHSDDRVRKLIESL